MERSATLVFFCALAACGQAVTTADEAELISLDPRLEAAALANLKRIYAELDAAHMGNYVTLPASTDPTFADTIAQAFLDAVKLEYQAKPQLLQRRVQMLASLVYFSNPEVTTDPAIGHVTPFHGLNDAAFEALMTNEDFVFDSHMAANGGSPNGVRPFSVCETKFLIAISTGTVTAPFAQNNVILDYDGYALAYQAYAASCPQEDLDEWYNFRGLGGLRPSWLESNYNDRVLRRMLKVCKTPSEDNKASCEQFATDRLAYRDKKNVAMALRQMVFDTASDSRIGDLQDGAYMANPGLAGVFLEDQNNDGVAEWLAPGSVSLKAGATLRVDATTSFTVANDGTTLIDATGQARTFTGAELAIHSTGQFSGELVLTVTFADGSSQEFKPGNGAIRPVSRVMPGWQPSFASQPDLGLSTLLADGDCSGERADPATCPLVKRFYSLIDRHENFYQTYSTFDPASSNVSSQPSPLVACSVTLRAAHHWDTAGTPPGGTAGFIYLMRIPFNEILSADVRSIDTLGRLKGDLLSGPPVMTIQDIVAGATSLDMGLVWLDIATLSNNQYANEHEISKFGTVPAGQIEGILVIRRPASMQTKEPVEP